LTDVPTLSIQGGNVRVRSMPQNFCKQFQIAVGVQSQAISKPFEEKAAVARRTITIFNDVVVRLHLNRRCIKSSFLPSTHSHLTRPLHNNLSTLPSRSANSFYSSPSTVINRVAAPENTAGCTSMARLLSPSCGRRALGNLLHLPHDAGSVLGLLAVGDSECAVVVDGVEALGTAPIYCYIRNVDDALRNALSFQGSRYCRTKCLD
jgi:hypothetical protein